MTTEEKAKAYDEALEKAKEWTTEREQVICPREIVESIFPQLCESEDEKIRKELISYFKAIKFVNNQPMFHGFKIDNILTWLEKQKEQKHPDGCFTCDEYKKGYEAGRLNGITAGYNKAMKEQKLTATINGEPIPTENQSVNIPCPEWSEEDEKMLKSIIGDLFCGTDFNMELKFAASKKVNWLKEKLKSISPQPKPSWSEEDKQWLSEVYFAIDHSMYSEDERQAMKKYIDSLRSQSKPAEWSEEEKKFLQVAISCTYDRGYLSVSNWLKSLRPCPSWKPSEHQMNILKAVKEYVGRGSGYWGEGLGSLIEDLEKL